MTYEETVAALEGMYGKFGLNEVEKEAVRTAIQELISASVAAAACHESGPLVGVHSLHLEPLPSPLPDMVNHPPHYTAHPSGIECIEITQWFNFNIGNAIKYLWRTDEKDDPMENLAKAAWYIAQETTRRGGHGKK